MLKFITCQLRCARCGLHTKGSPLRQLALSLPPTPFSFSCIVPLSLSVYLCIALLLYPHGSAPSCLSDYMSPHLSLPLPRSSLLSSPPISPVYTRSVACVSIQGHTLIWACWYPFTPFYFITGGPSLYQYGKEAVATHDSTHST